MGSALPSTRSIGLECNSPAGVAAVPGGVVLRPRTSGDGHAGTLIWGRRTPAVAESARFLSEPRVS
ncbi:hypothetical protein GCM10010129_13290 [Streptomyces fumigatiscleroticus]|nr:hypothetical protein GCM10010129_13290 [Streptomyces fumigatiscleroticus]